MRAWNVSWVGALYGIVLTVIHVPGIVRDLVKPSKNKSIFS